MRYLTLLMVGLLSGLPSCTPTNREQVAREVLTADPSFGAVLGRRRELENRIETYERELALKRSAVERAITQLRRELAAAATSVRMRITEVKKRLEPERSRLQLALSMANNELQAKQAQRASLGRSIASLKKALRESYSGWSEAEQAKQQARIDELLEEVGRIDQEIATINAHMRLLRRKLLLIKW